VNPHTLSPGAQGVLEDARAEAERLGHDSVGAEHILLALLRTADAGAILTRLGLDLEQVKSRLAATGRRGRTRASGGGLGYTSHAKRLIEIASKEAREAGTVLGAEQLLLAALHEPRGTMARILAEQGISPDSARHALGGAPAARAPTRAGREPGSSHQASPPPAARSKTVLGIARWRLVLLLAVPLSIVLGYVLHAPGVWIFITACLGVLPLAAFMGDATEHLSHRTGPTIGGLLNATFGNAAELIIAIVALRAGLVDLVKASITGSILGNLLLILGLAIVVGGLNRHQLRFNRTGAGLGAGMMALAVVGLVFPALFHALHPGGAARMSELRMSEAVALILLATYGFSLLFTLKTHRHLLGGEPHPMDGPVWSMKKAIGVLALATTGVAVESELLVHAANAATASLGLTPVFLGLIVVPIIGNAAEHAAAVMLSRKGQIELGLQIALGSSTQVALLVAPLLVFAGVALGQNMDLVFRPFEVLALMMAVIVTAIITLDGESHWFEGVQLLAVYGMVAVAAYFLI
jgi:Ca2+:H+ antiporter